MLVLLGFLLATLLALALAPAFRRRAERLTIERVRQSMPVTEAEITADKDRLRAQFAIRVHKLEQDIEKFRLAAARHIVDINRRDAAIASLESEVERLKAEHEEHANARRVLEHTISDRMPKIEQRLAEARKLLQQRDREMASLSSEATRGIRARDEALQANAQQRAEIDRLMATLSTRPPKDGSAAARYSAEADGKGSIHEDAQLAAVRQEADAHIAALKAKLDDQATEMSKLQAALAAYEPAKEGGPRAGRIMSRSRIQALEAEVKSQAETIHRLRADLAASNERAARQAAHYVEEMRRLRTAAPAPSTQPKRASGEPQRRTLAERLGQTAALGGRPPAGNGAGTPEPAEPGSDSGKVTEFLKALSEPESAPRPDATEETSAKRAEEPARKIKPRLLDRLTGSSKS